VLSCELRCEDLSGVVWPDEFIVWGVCCLWN